MIFNRAYWFTLIALSGLVFTCSSAEAQQATKIPRIGFLVTTPPAPFAGRIVAFRQALIDLGYVEGQNIALEWRFADGSPDRLLKLAAELVRIKVDIIVAVPNSAIDAAKLETQTIPIVMPIGSDPVGVAFVASLARPSGNITGLSAYSLELNGKRLELLKETVPKLSIALQSPPDPR